VDSAIRDVLGNATLKDLMLEAQAADAISKARLMSNPATQSGMPLPMVRS
jgi:hypothetical protein